MGAAGLAAAGRTATAAQSTKDSRKASPKRYGMKKSINQWAFPYPERMNLRECLQLAKNAGFDGIELNYDLENDLSPKHGPKEYQKIRKMADAIGIDGSFNAQRYLSGPICTLPRKPRPQTAQWRQGLGIYRRWRVG